MNNQRVTLLLLLDVSATFDTVDYDTLLHRLQFSFGMRGKVLFWFKSYLSGRSQQVLINDVFSGEFSLECGEPQGSCLGPILFTFAPLTQGPNQSTCLGTFIILRHNSHLYIHTISSYLEGKLFEMQKWLLLS